VHECVVLGEKGGGGDVIWCGVDFLIRHSGEPLLLEFNVKPCTRYLRLSQFDCPLGRQIAQEAVRGFVELMSAEATGVGELPQQEASTAGWVRVR